MAIIPVGIDLAKHVLPLTVSIKPVALRVGVRQPRATRSTNG